MTEMTPLFLAALHEAGRTAARDESRYALTRVQIQGKTGQVVGTDGKQALIQGGFTFPFAENVLVPAIPVFGMKDLTAQADVRVGLTTTHLVVTAGPWTVWLLLDAEGRFPDVAGAVPKSRMTTTLEVGTPAALMNVIRSLPAGDEREPSTTVTLNLGPKVVIRARGAADTAPVEAVIAQAAIVGPPLLVAVDRQHFVRSLSLGFQQFRFVATDRPWVASDTTRTYLAAGLDPSVAIGTATSGDKSAVALPALPQPLRRTEMPARTTPDPAQNGHADPPPNGDLIDPLVEAEGLRRCPGRGSNPPRPALSRT